MHVLKGRDVPGTAGLRRVVQGPAPLCLPAASSARYRGAAGFVPRPPVSLLLFNTGSPLRCFLLAPSPSAPYFLLKCFLKERLQRGRDADDIQSRVFEGGFVTAPTGE